MDNVALQDGYDFYHHTIFFTKDCWCVVQQGMNPRVEMARRYHLNGIHSQKIETERIERKVLNLISEKSEGCRDTILDIVRDGEFRRFKLPKKIDWKALERAYELQPKFFEDFLLVRGVGKRTVRALAFNSGTRLQCTLRQNGSSKVLFCLGWERRSSPFRGR